MATYWENSCSFGLRYVSWYKYLIVSLVFSHLGFWSGNLFLIAPFPDLCLLVPFFEFFSQLKPVLFIYLFSVAVLLPMATNIILLRLHTRNVATLLECTTVAIAGYTMCIVPQLRKEIEIYAH